MDSYGFDEYEDEEEDAYEDGYADTVSDDDYFTDEEDRELISRYAARMDDDPTS